jgi:hypothetical protein
MYRHHGGSATKGHYTALCKDSNSVVNTIIYVLLWIPDIIFVFLPILAGLYVHEYIYTETYSYVHLYDSILFIILVA